MNNLTHQVTERTPIAALSHAAQCLAKAAATLSEAAQAMSEVAELLASGDSKPPPQNNESSKQCDVTNPIVSYESDSELSLMGVGNDGGGSARSLQNVPKGEERANPEETPCYASDREELENFVEHSTSESVNTRRDWTGHTESENTPTANYAHRILVEHEVDVLLFTCALIAKFDKVVCYMYCNVPTFNIYQNLISAVTEIPVCTLNKVSPSEIERVGKEFLRKERSVILLPESVAPHILLDEKISCVIHVGWPAKEHAYESQLKVHRSKNNVVVAYAEDQDLYSAGAAIVQRTQPWPENTESFRISIAILRPLFDQKLAELPYQLKAKAYPEWISFHGASGPRHVAAWTPSVLIYRANLYLLDVLRYDAPAIDPNGTGPALRVPLPEVSAGFVKANGLETAVEQGILRVKRTNSSLNHISSLSRGDFTPVGMTATNQTTPTNNQHLAHLNNSFGSLSKPSSSAPLGSSHIANPFARGRKFSPTPGYTYFTLEEDFDAIPLICFLALTYATEKVVVFLDDLGCLPHYQKLINKITGRTVMITPGTTTDDQARSNQNAALAFMEYSAPAILLLSCRLSNLPPALESSPVGCCLYWAAGDYVPLLQAQRNCTRLTSYITHVIMTRGQRELKGSMINTLQHPSSPDLIDPSTSSWLSAMRETTRSVLIDNQQIVKSLYGAYCYFFGKIPRNVLSAEGVARRLNRYSARVLLRGDPEDGSQRFPPVSGRFVTPARLIGAFDLQPAVDVGMLVVGHS